MHKKGKERKKNGRGNVKEKKKNKKLAKVMCKCI